VPTLDSTKGTNTYYMIFHKNLRHIVKIPLTHFLEPIADILLDEFHVLINDNIRRGGFLLGIRRDRTVSICIRHLARSGGRANP